MSTTAHLAFLEQSCQSGTGPVTPFGEHLNVWQLPECQIGAGNVAFVGGSGRRAQPLGEWPGFTLVGRPLNDISLEKTQASSMAAPTAVAWTQAARPNSSETQTSMVKCTQYSGSENVPTPANRSVILQALAQQLKQFYNN